MGVNVSKILIIAGFDPSGNAGLLRDLEIVHSFNLKASSAVTALTAQNQKKFLHPQVVEPSVFKNQLLSVAPLSQYRAIKIGMLGNEKIVRVLVHFLKQQKKIPPIVLDPVLSSSTGGELLTKKGKEELWKNLIPLVDLWTPNLDEASFFCGFKLQSPLRMEKASDQLWKKKRIPILLKGGHLKGDPQDLLKQKDSKTWLIYPRQHVKNLRGTGCALSTLITVHLAQGYPLDKAVKTARQNMDHSMEFF